jgi:GT2 family glycosyltransferase
MSDTSIAVSVVVRTKDEADRLRLMLLSLLGQPNVLEVIVVDDGSSDHTRAVLDHAVDRMPLRVVRHATARGRSAASNAGARIARGELLLFMDGDTLAGPGCVAVHARAHAPHGFAIGRGETFHLRCTRFLLDPATASPRPGEEARMARMPAEEVARLRITEHDIAHDFASIRARAEPGIYPGAGPRRLYELEMDALIHHAQCSVLWAAASGCNLSVRRERFLASGGFMDELDINEHREFALRACHAGAHMIPVPGARTYHMTHRSGWRDPLDDRRWEQQFHAAHPLPEVRLLPSFWATVGGRVQMPDEARIESLPDLERAARAHALAVTAPGGSPA